MRYYIVEPGDTLYGISRQFGVNIDTIRQINSLTNNNLVVGQTLRIPITSNYTVKKGDSLYSIAKAYNTDVETIKRLNNLTSNLLSIGQVLYLPYQEEQSPGGYTNYTVKKGDSLYSISKVYDTTVDVIKTLNNLTSNNLSIGQILKIPTSINTDINYMNYIVKSGDTLYSIASNYNTSIEDLKTLNNLTSNILSVGLTLKIPNTSSGEPLSCYGEGYIAPTYITYTVKKGDSLWTIAKKYNTSIDNLIALNNLSSSNLSIGQVLKIREVI